jgi:pyridoxamine 5'-phosphate oxidase
MENDRETALFTLFGQWFADARAHEPNDAEAMSVASIDADGQPSVRIVLVKVWDARGFVFFTNLQSRKGVALLANPKTCLNFHWKSLRRQVRIEGVAVRVSDSDADDYFATRARASQIGAWASDQSRPLDSRATFESRLAAETARFDGTDVPRPPHWSGFRVIPARVEFWQEIDFRLHHRQLFVRDGDTWSEGLLYP